MVETGILFQNTEQVPVVPHVKLLTHLDNFTLGTKLANLVALDNKILAKEYIIRLNTMIERDTLESSGYGDQLMEMKEFSWPVKRIKNCEFQLIEMCFSYRDD